MNNFEKYKMVPSFEDSDLSNAYVEGFNDALKLCEEIQNTSIARRDQVIALISGALIMLGIVAMIELCR